MSLFFGGASGKVLVNQGRGSSSRPKQLLRDLLAARYPVLFVDESQDTTPALIDALRTVAKTVGHEFCLGFFGDPMQKIYTAGAGAVALEEGWRELKKPENFRCPQSVPRVINSIRAEDDRLEQVRGRTIRQDGRDVLVNGTARLFLLPADEKRTERVGQVRRYLSRNNNDPLWESDAKAADVRMLVVVHRMAASRLGFPDLYAALNDDAPDSLKDGVVDGTAWPLRPFMTYLLPLASAVRAEDDFEVVAILRDRGPLSNPAALQDVAKILVGLEAATTELNRLLSDPATTVRPVITFAIAAMLFVADERLSRHLAVPTAPEDEMDPERPALAAFLASPAIQLWEYKKYIEDLSPFATQQGVKGAEFDRVMVLLDDEEGRGQTLFNYGKYLGITELSPTDKANIAEGKDSVIARTRRLFYVCCSRAVQDLAVVLFVPDVAAVRDAVAAKGFFPVKDVICEEAL